MSPPTIRRPQTHPTWVAWVARGAGSGLSGGALLAGSALTRFDAGHAESVNEAGVRRCQRLPDVTHPVDPTRPASHIIKSRTRANPSNQAENSHSLEEDVLSG